MSNLISFEPYVNTTVFYFFNQIDKLFVQTGDICDLGTWLQMFAFDVMGELTFSKRLGFLERARRRRWNYEINLEFFMGLLF